MRVKGKKDSDLLCCDLLPLAFNSFFVSEGSSQVNFVISQTARWMTRALTMNSQHGGALRGKTTLQRRQVQTTKQTTTRPEIYGMLTERISTTSCLRTKQLFTKQCVCLLQMIKISIDSCASTALKFGNLYTYNTFHHNKDISQHTGIILAQ